MKNDRPLGIYAIAKQLGCSVRTVCRLHAIGAIPSFKASENTSPIKMSCVDLRKLKRKRKK